MNNFLSAILLLVFTNILHCQEFKTTIWIEDGLGRLDSILIGYDPFATESIDEDFNEIDISNQLWSDFEIRAAQIDVSEIITGYDVRNPKSKLELIRYESKTEIIPKDCLSLIEGNNPFGYVPFITLFIKTDSYPITLKWKQSDFENNCVEKSIVSDWPITTWWDIPCCTNLEINKTSFNEQNSFIINRHLGMKVVDQTNDTLIMLNIVLNDGLGTNTSEVDDENNFIVFPNPANGEFSVPENVSKIALFDVTGRSISYVIKSGRVFTNYIGIIFVRFERNSKFYTTKLINY